MELLNIIFLMLLAVGMTRILGNILPIPLPLIQIAMGALIAIPSFGVRMEMDPQIFMVLFIPILLFADAYKIPKTSFIRNSTPILTMAFGMVVVLVVVIGYLINYLIPAIPLAACFALAAVLSPTDAVAVSAIAHGRLPEKMSLLLAGESMVNDASGLTCFQLAMIATMTGVFSIYSATWSFVSVALGGVAVGAVIAWLVGKTKVIMNDRGFSDPVTPVVIMLLIPFVSFVTAEHLGVSGILAAVAAGWVKSRAEMQPKHIQTRMMSRSIWTVLEDIFSACCFIMLGNQLPAIINGVRTHSLSTSLDSTWLILDVVIITAALLLMRFVWIFGYKKIAAMISRRRGESVAPEQDGWVSALMAVSGVRGAITLAAVLSVPLFIGDKPFPGRDVMIFTAMGVIILTLVIASVGIPLLLRFVAGDEEQTKSKEMLMARIASSDAAIRFLEEWEHTHAVGKDACEAALMAEVVARIMGDYRQDVDALDSAEDVRKRAQAMETLERDLRLKAIQVQRKELLRLRRKRHLDDEAMSQMSKDLDYNEAALA